MLAFLHIEFRFYAFENFCPNTINARIYSGLQLQNNSLILLIIAVITPLPAPLPPQTNNFLLTSCEVLHRLNQGLVCCFYVYPSY